MSDEEQNKKLVEVPSEEEKTAKELPMTDEEQRMTFIEHLTELRIRLIRSIIAIVVCAFLCFGISEYIFNALMDPLMPLVEEGGVKIITLSVFGMYFLFLKIAGVGGVLMASPYILWQICAFVFPGLRSTEKKVIKVMLLSCSGLAIAGILVAYQGVLPLVLPYIMTIIPDTVDPTLDVNITVTLIVKLMLGFAIGFQFPLVVLLLVFMGLLEPKALRQYRAHAIVGLAVLSALFTPPDPITMVIMMTPMVLLYEVSIWVSYIVVRRKAKAQQG